jgi:hypothetical protein
VKGTLALSSGEAKRIGGRPLEFLYGVLTLPLHPQAKSLRFPDVKPSSLKEIAG